MSFYLIIRLLSKPSLILSAANKIVYTFLLKRTQFFSMSISAHASTVCLKHFPWSVPSFFFLICRSLEDDDDVWTRTRQEAANLSASINEILGSYDPKLRPNAGGESALWLPLHMQWHLLHVIHYNGSCNALHPTALLLSSLHLTIP